MTSRIVPWLVAVVGLVAAGCSMDMQGKDHCATSADCLGGKACVNQRCLADAGAGASNGGHDGSMSPADGSSTNRDGSSDHQDGPAPGQDATHDLRSDSNVTRDSSSDLGDGSSDHQDASHDLSSGNQDASHGPRDGSNDHADASPKQDGAADGGLNIVGTCDGGTVTECPGPTPKGQCQQIYCGGRLWLGPSSTVGHIPYRILDPNGLFSEGYKAAIRGRATAWADATNGLVTFAECTKCTGRFISVVPGSGDGIQNPGDWEELLPLPVDSTAPGVIPSHRIAHQWGHAIGLDDTYRRPDRAGYASFDPMVWCRSGTSLPATCAYSDPTQQPGSPPIPSGTFGAYDELSVMNGLPSEGVCGGGGAGAGSVEPTLGDVSAVEELYYGIEGPWSPFQPITRSRTAGGPPDYQLAPNVDPVGGPAIAEWTAPLVDIVVRGSDGKVYETWNDLSGASFLDWASWTVVADHVDADPALVFAGSDILYLVVRSSIDGSIRLRRRTSGAWGQWASLGAPSVGAASAPAITAQDAQSLSVFVRGGDSQIYALECSDPGAMCAASAAAVNAWGALPVPDVGGFLGKPSAAWRDDGSGVMYVTAVGVDHVTWIIGPGPPPSWGGWLPLYNLPVSPDDSEPGAPMLSNGGIFAWGQNGLLRYLGVNLGGTDLGGLLISTPGAVSTTTQGDTRMDVVAIIDDHGHPGVWWKFLSSQDTPPCNYNAPGTCGQCGCDLPGDPRCDY